ncbi:restriction endonuclease subunit S [Neobacillus niacini]|uniref:restriction endonuclease subunit S n=1 Tax=Neobacillus niacini TaxID=86668 RepID=UPI0007AC29F7|nr:restriction endonuclease subunit S [Neobacillus niacini]MEC1524460.1 restriction endonuclease subunit S [Neobacillus niacini]
MNDNLKPYESYNDVNLPWLDKIPSHWEMIRNKNVMKLKKDVVGEQSGNYTLLSLTLKGIIARDMKNPKGKFPKDFSTYQVVNENDLVFCLFDIDETPRTVGLSPLNGMITGAYTVFKIADINPKYLYYYYLSLDGNKLLKPLYTGLRKVINTDTFLRTKFPLPPRDEQEQIVKYLDSHLSKINKFISIKKKIVAALKEQKQSIIYKAVTQGIYPNRSMQKTNVDYLGYIPEEWKTSKVKFMFAIKKDIAGSEGYDVLSVTQQGIKIKDISKNEGQMAQDYSNYQLVNPNDFVMNHMDLLTGFMDCSNYYGVTSPDYRVFTFKNGIEKNNRNKYYTYFFQSCYSFKIFYGLGQGVSSMGRWRLQADKFLNFPVPVPSLAEQQEIEKYIEQRTKQIDKLIDKTQSEIELMTEYRTCLISEVVTGKVDVQGIVVDGVIEDDLDLADEDFDENETEEVEDLEEVEA